MIETLTPALDRADRELERELRRLGEEAKRWFLAGQAVEGLRIRNDGDTTHEFDDALEQRLLAFFTRSGLPVRFSSEEQADVDLVASPELLALVDPLDGSDVAARGYPLCSISVCVVDLATTTPLVSRIVEVFTGRQYAARGSEATMDGHPMRPSSVRSAGDALVVSYFASRSRIGKFSGADGGWSSCKTVLNYGGLLDIAKVGSGQCDAMIEVLNGMVAREYLAGVHIARAAGAIATTLSGAPIPVLVERNARSNFLVAATPQLHAELMAAFAG